MQLKLMFEKVNKQLDTKLELEDIFQKVVNRKLATQIKTNTLVDFISSFDVTGPVGHKALTKE